MLLSRPSEESPRMFESDFIDQFSRTPWLLVPAIHFPIVGAILWHAATLGVPVLTTSLAFVVGAVLWTLTEYWLHRTLFHWTPDTSWGPKFHFYSHGVHHKWHQDRFRLVMPPPISLFLALVFYGLFKGAAALGALAGFGTGWHWGGFAGFVVGYVVYDCMHYILHHWRPRTLWMKKLRAHHMAHHHNPAYAEKKFGVSNTLWDHVFGTM